MVSFMQFAFPFCHVCTEAVGRLGGAHACVMGALSWLQKLNCNKYSPALEAACEARRILYY